MVFSNNLLMGAAGQGGAGYEIDQSILFNSADTATLTKTFGTATNRKIFTFSVWVKNGNSSGSIVEYNGTGGVTWANINFGGNRIDYFDYSGGSARIDLRSTAVFRDPSAWYHVVVAMDTTQGTASNRLKFYINGTQVTDFGTSTYPSLNFEGFINSSVSHLIGKGTNGPFDGYLAEYHFIDGQALAPTDFGEYNDAGVWIPKEYDGSYGTNGFYITGATDSDLGEDFSGNGNDFTSSGLATTDQMMDTPTNNFAVQNYITQDVDNLNWSEGNLNILADSSSQWHTIPATIYPQSGKWGYQATIKSSTAYIMIGWMSEGDIEDGIVGGGKTPSSGTNSNCAFLYNFEAQKHVNDASTLTSGLAGLATNDVVECLMDIDNGTISWKKNGSAYASFTGLNTTDNPLTVPMVAVYGSSSYQVELDYGQGGYTPSDSDYKTICTANLDTPAIKDGSKYFNTVLYEGNGGGQRVGQFQPLTEIYTVPNSVIFNDNDSASLTRTPSSAGDRRTFTFSCWVKRANLTGANQPIFSAGGDDWLMFLSAETLGFNTSGSNYRIVTNQVFKDTSTWFHVVLRVDTTNATAGDRLRLYINGSEITDFGTDTNPTLNFETAFNNTGEHRIGKLVGASQYFDGYLAETNHIDGQSLGPDSFGQLDASTNRWIPKDTSGLTFGTNGFYLDMETAPGTGSGAGTDSSGNGNNWTESGLAASDQVTDSPTNNQSVLDANRVDAYTLSQGNLFTNAVGDAAAIGTIPFDPQDEEGFYFEAKVTTAATYPNVAIRTLADIPTVSSISGDATGRYAYTGSNGQFNDEGTGVSYGDVWAGTADKVIGVYIKAGELFFSVDGTIQNSGTPAKTGLTGLMVPTVFYDAGSGTHASWEMRFSSSDWSTTPSGYKSISTDNLPLSSGELSAFVWIKNRDATDNHMLFDAVRGATKDVHSNSTAAEVTNANTLTRFLKNGFEISNDAEVNTSGESYVAWQWLNDSLSTSSNEDGDITSTVLANTTAGFSIATYTGNATSSQTVGHGLGQTPSLVMFKELDSSSYSWQVYHVSLGYTQRLILDGTNAAIAATNIFDAAPSSTVFTIGNSAGINTNSASHVMYSFAEIPGYSSFGSYTGNGSTDGPFIFTNGMKPAFVILKRTNATQEWQTYDTERDPFNVADHKLEPNSSNVESILTGNNNLDFLSSGFKLRQANGGMNASGSTYIYMAFAENPFGGDGAAPATAR